MSDSAVLVWLLRITLGGGALLFFAWLAQRWVRDPLRQQRLGEWAVAAALVVAGVGLAPAWLVLRVLPAEPAPEPVAKAEEPDEPVDWQLIAFVPAEVQQEEPVPAAVVAPAEPARPAWTLSQIVVWVYGAVAAVFLGRWLLANFAVWWLLRSRRPVSPALAELFAEMAWPRRARLVVSDRVDMPFSVGLVRPTVVLPVALVERATTEELRWVLAHELSHLERQDTRTCWLFVLGQVVYFYLPWFWWLRREVRLSQEYLADAAAVEWAGSPADYAQFLVSWAGRGKAVPLYAGAATGVTGSGSDLFRRVTMLLESTNVISARPSRRWLRALAGGLVAVGLVVGGVSLRAVAAEDKKADEKKAEEKKPEPKKVVGGVDLDALFDQLGANIDDESLKQLKQQMDEVRKQMKEMQEELKKTLPRGGLGGVIAMPNNLGQGGAIAFPGGAVMPGQGNLFLGGHRHQQRLGAQVSKPSSTLVDQLDLPKDQGMVLEAVGANSAAAKAGMKAHDILVELNGKTVSSKVEDFLKMVADIKANTPVDAVVLRKGKKETIKGLSLPEAKAVNMQGFGPGGGAFGGVPGQLGGIAFGPGAAAGGGGKAVAGGKGGMTSITRNNDEFTTKFKDGDLSIAIKGTIDQGKAKVTEIVVDEGKGQSSTYSSVEKVPGTHKEKVQKLIEMSGKSSVRFPLDD